MSTDLETQLAVKYAQIEQAKNIALQYASITLEDKSIYANWMQPAIDMRFEQQLVGKLKSTNPKEAEVIYRNYIRKKPSIVHRLELSVDIQTILLRDHRIEEPTKRNIFTMEPKHQTTLYMALQHNKKKIYIKLGKWIGTVNNGTQFSLYFRNDQDRITMLDGYQTYPVCKVDIEVSTRVLKSVSVIDFNSMNLIIPNEPDLERNYIIPWKDISSKSLIEGDPIQINYGSSTNFDQILFVEEESSNHENSVLKSTIYPVNYSITNSSEYWQNVTKGKPKSGFVKPPPRRRRWGGGKKSRKLRKRRPSTRRGKPQKKRSTRR